MRIQCDFCGQVYPTADVAAAAANTRSHRLGDVVRRAGEVGWTVVTIGRGARADRCPDCRHRELQGARLVPLTRYELDLHLRRAGEVS